MNAVINFFVLAQFVPQPSVANLGEPISNNIPTENQDQDQPFNIFEYIGRPTAEREVRKKLNNMAGSGKKMGKMEALNMLMSIAGDHWEKDLLMGQKDDNSDGLSGKYKNIKDKKIASTFYHRNMCWSEFGVETKSHLKYISIFRYKFCLSNE